LSKVVFIFIYFLKNFHVNLEKIIFKGAITPLYLAFLPENASGPRGELWAEKQKVQWDDLSWTWGK
jgi:hypothetical protein